MKTQTVIKEKVRDYKFYNPQTGVYKFDKVIIELFQLIALAILYKFALTLIWGVQLNITNLQNNIDVFIGNMSTIYSNIFDLNLRLVENQLFLAPDIIIILYIGIAIYNYLKAKIQQKLSALGMENYRYKKKGKKHLFILKTGEEIEFDYVLSIKEDIKQRFGLNGSIKIERLNNSDIVIEELEDFEKTEIKKEQLKDGFIYFGLARELGEKYIKITELTHYLIAGASGSEKSVFQNLLVASFIYNLKWLNKLHMVDLKGGTVEFGRYKSVDKVDVIGDIEQLLILTRELIAIMETRYQEMSEKGVTNYLDVDENQTIIVMIDEYATIENMGKLMNKDDFKELKLNMLTLLAKARASAIKFLIATQKATSDNIDTTLRENLQSRILLRTSASEAQKAVLSTLDAIEEFDVNPKYFDKGQYIMYDDTTQEDYFIQAPFVADGFYKAI
jgi:hypothetical protein